MQKGKARVFFQCIFAVLGRQICLGSSFINSEKYG